MQSSKIGLKTVMVEINHVIVMTNMTFDPHLGDIEAIDLAPDLPLHGIDVASLVLLAVAIALRMESMVAMVAVEVQDARAEVEVVTNIANEARRDIVGAQVLVIIVELCPRQVPSI